MNNKPIGIFDSGIGGISILDKLTVLFPNENFIYLADNKNFPYGNKSKEDILTLSIKNCKKLIEFNCKIIIVACNTATTNSIKKLRKIIPVTIIGVEPGIKPAINFTITKNVGVLATEKTLESKLFFKTSDKNKTYDIKIHKQKGNELVNLIEEGLFSKNKIQKVLKSCLEPITEKNIDCLVLGCTHYHHIIELIREILPKSILIIDTITPITKHIINVLNLNKSLNQSNKKGYINIFYNGKKISENYIRKEYNIYSLEF